MEITYRIYMTLVMCVRVDIDRNLLKDGFCKFSFFHYPFETNLHLTSTNSCSRVTAVDFFNQVNILHGTLTEFCTPVNCPTMTAGPKYFS
jgi:hypothetical protein